MVSCVVQVLAAFMLGEKKKKKGLLHAGSGMHCLKKPHQNKTPNRVCLQLFSITALSACNCSMFSIKECQINEHVRV